ncbi:hypothetical protein [Streptomyces bluensis]|uniref:hypothetical protein n=1 Tax=Streptomyces bluensis TaxID=33897 RepID=UPI00332AFF2C
MSVFARLFRKSKATEEASIAEAQAERPTAESEAQGTDEGKRPRETTESEATAVRAEADEVEAGEVKAEETAPKKIAPEEPGAGDDVEIPKQQTAEQAADNGAGESAAHDCCSAGR